jgi:hypothetical protein
MGTLDTVIRTLLAGTLAAGLTAKAMAGDNVQHKKDANGNPVVEYRVESGDTTAVYRDGKLVEYHIHNNSIIGPTTRKKTPEKFKKLNGLITKENRNLYVELAQYQHDIDRDFPSAYSTIHGVISSYDGQRVPLPIQEVAAHIYRTYLSDRAKGKGNDWSCGETRTVVEDLFKRGVRTRWVVSRILKDDHRCSLGLTKEDEESLLALASKHR